jgi:DNA polymerase-3 subunit epsilon
MDFIALDFETATGKRNSAVSIGLVRFVDGKAADTHYTLIRPPELYIRPDFTDIHGITVDDVTDAPTFEEAWDGIHDFIRNNPRGSTLAEKPLLAAHNAQFDMGVLSAVLEHYGLSKPNVDYFCTLELSRKAWPGMASHALTALADRFDIKYDAHNALADAETCGRLALMAADRLECEYIEDLMEKCRLAVRML